MNGMFLLRCFNLYSHTVLLYHLLTSQIFDLEEQINDFQEETLGGLDDLADSLSELNQNLSPRFDPSFATPSIVYIFLNEQEFIKPEGRISVKPGPSARELATETRRPGLMGKKSLGLKGRFLLPSLFLNTLRRSIQARIGINGTIAL
jgi:hypothetical protein